MFSFLKGEGVIIYVILIVILLDSYVFEMMLIMIGVIRIIVCYGLVYEYVIWVELLNRGCVCYSNKHNAFDRGWL